MKILSQFLPYMFLFILWHEYDIEGVMHVYCMICVVCGHNSRRIPRTSTDIDRSWRIYRVTSRVGVMSTIFINKSPVIRQSSRESAFLMSKRVRAFITRMYLPSRWSAKVEFIDQLLKYIKSGHGDDFVMWLYEGWTNEISCLYQVMFVL